MLGQYSDLQVEMQQGILIWKGDHRLCILFLVPSHPQIPGTHARYLVDSTL